MSAGRKLRRQAQRSQIARAVSDARGAVPAFVRTMNAREELWKIGPVLSIVPAVPVTGTPEEIRVAKLRRATSLEGVCPDCGAVRRIKSQGSHFRLVVRHEQACPVSGVNVEEIVRPVERGER